MTSRRTVPFAALAGLLAVSLLPPPAQAYFKTNWARRFDGAATCCSTDLDQGRSVFWESTRDILIMSGRQHDNIGGLKHWVAAFKSADGSTYDGPNFTSGAGSLGDWDAGGFFPRGDLAPSADGFLYLAADTGADIGIYRFPLLPGATKALRISGPGSCQDAAQEAVLDPVSSELYVAGFLGDCSSGTFKAASWVARIPPASANPELKLFYASTGSVKTSGWPNRIHLGLDRHPYVNFYTGQPAGTIRLQKLDPVSLAVLSTFTFVVGEQARLFDFGFHPFS
ncbi:MAG: hypothetical protein WC728_02270, partial [Elusimicrobiota bacterium]